MSKDPRKDPRGSERSDFVAGEVQTLNAKEQQAGGSENHIWDRCVLQFEAWVLCHPC